MITDLEYGRSVIDLQNQQQAYTIGLVFEEMLNNEAIRITKPVEGKPDEVASKLLKESVGTAKTLSSEPALRKVKFMAYVKDHLILLQKWVERDFL